MGEARQRSLRAPGVVSPNTLFKAMDAHQRLEDARRSLGPAGFAARQLQMAIVAAQTQQRMLEACGLDPVATGCFDENGVPAAALDEDGRLICVIGPRLDSPVWTYATRADGLERLLQPAIAALDAVAPEFSPAAASARSAVRRAIADARERDLVARS